MGIIIILSRVKLVSFPEFDSLHSAPLVGVNVNSLFTDKYLSGRAWGTYIPQLLFALTPGHSQWEGDDPRRAPVVGLLWSDVNGKNLRYECEVPEKSRVTFRYAEHSHSSGKFVAEDAKLRSSISASWRVRSGAIDVNTQVVNRYANRTVKLYFYVDDAEGSLGDYRISGLEEATQRQLKWPSAEKFNVAELIQLRKRKIRKNGKILPGFDLVDGGGDCKDQSCLSLWVVEVADNATLRVRLESEKIAGSSDVDDEGYETAVRRLWPNLKREMYHAVASVVGGVADTRGELLVKDGPPVNRSLISMVPSRSFFPRGFLWDEGFHLLLMEEWDPTRALHDRTIANPPALLLTIRSVIAEPKENFNTVESVGPILRTLVAPHLDGWYDFLDKTQASPFSTSSTRCPRWTGRTAAHNLASGLDDYPRGVLVDEGLECHVDLTSWMVLFADTMVKINSTAVGVRPTRFWRSERERLQSLLRTTMVNEKGIFSDLIGRQIVEKRKGKEGSVLSRPPWVGRGTAGQCSPMNGIECDPYSDAPCCSPSGWCGGSRDHCECEGCIRYLPLEERMKKDKAFGRKYTISAAPVHSPHVGYVTIFPLLLGLLHPIEDRQIILATIDVINKELMTPYGLGSLSKSDQLYRMGEDYWRGKIWGNINLLAIGALRHYGSVMDDSTISEMADSIRKGYMKTVEDGFKKKKSIYENYTPDRGEPAGAAPFTGWTAVAYVLATEEDNHWWEKAVGTLSADQARHERYVSDEL
ncbi:WD repeat-containing protein 19 [Perkinsus olseni]|nr:WD repeat-containing protein 19 [Perkinsus olseni]